MICITGATGTVGRLLVEELKRRKADFLVMARDVARAHALLGSDVAVRKGDFSDMASMTTAFAGVDRLFLLCAPGPQMGEHELAAVEAARRAGVRHVVKVSVPGASPVSPSELVRMHGRVEAAIENSGMAWTHLRPNGFMQNLWGPTQGLRKDGTFQLCVGDAHVPMIDAADIAAVAAVALLEPGHEGKIYDLTGGEAPTYHEVAAIFTRLLGVPITYRPLSPSEAHDLFVSEGLPEGLVSELIGLFTLMAAGHGAEITTTVKDITGNPPTNFEDFVARHLATFRDIIGSNAMEEDFLKLLQDERAIRRVKHAYFAASDRFDVAAVLETMTDDIVWDGGPALGRHVGKEAIGGLIGFVGGITKFTAHLATNEIIDVSGDIASGRWWLVVPSTVVGEGGTVAQWLFAYTEAEFRRQAEGWKISGIRLEPRAHGTHAAGWA